MTKTNFDKMARLPMFAMPPGREEVRSPVTGYGAGRAADGRSARKTGRDKQFATVVTEEFKQWMKVTAAKVGKTQASLLDDMKDAYIEKHGD
jgi:hypothetical protein